MNAPRRRATVENPEFAAFAACILRAAARRVADGDVEGLTALVALRCELDEAIADAVAGLRSPPLVLLVDGRRPCARDHPPGRPAALRGEDLDPRGDLTT